VLSSGVERVDCWVSEWVRGQPRSNSCELLLFESDSWRTGIVPEPRVRVTSAVGSRYKTTTGEDAADWEDLVRVVVKCRVCELAIALQLLVLTICEFSTDPITNPNPVYSHSYTWQHTQELSIIPDKWMEMQVKIPYKMRQFHSFADLASIVLWEMRQSFRIYIFDCSKFPIIYGTRNIFRTKDPVLNQFNHRRIRGSEDGDYEENCLLRYNAVKSGRYLLTFQRNLMRPSFGIEE
jgi:hypothetical protein